MRGGFASTQVSVGLWAAAVLLFNFPVVLIWDRDITVGGLPLLPVALFVIWGLLIACLALAVERRGTGRPPPPG